MEQTLARIEYKVDLLMKFAQVVMDYMLAEIKRRDMYYGEYVDEEEDIEE